jgi:hypothetical protein
MITTIRWRVFDRCFVRTAAEVYRLEASPDVVTITLTVGRHPDNNSTSHLFTFLEHPEAPPGNNASERELRPTATYRKVTGGFRSHWHADLFAAVRSVIGTAARRGIDAYQATHAVLDADSVIQSG